MNRDVLLGAGVVLAFIVLVNRAKKNQVTDTKGGGGGGGFGGGPFVGGVPAGPMTVNNIIQPATSGGGVKPTPVSPTVAAGLGSTQVAASTSSTGVGNTGVGVENTGGIVPVGQGGSVTPTYSTGTVTQADLKSGVAGNTVFKPFSGDAKFLGFVGSRPKFEFN